MNDCLNDTSRKYLIRLATTPTRYVRNQIPAGSASWIHLSNPSGVHSAETGHQLIQLAGIDDSRIDGNRFEYSTDPVTNQQNHQLTNEVVVHVSRRIGSTFYYFQSYSDVWFLNGIESVSCTSRAGHKCIGFMKESFISELVLLSNACGFCLISTDLWITYFN